MFVGYRKENPHSWHTRKSISESHSQRFFDNGKFFGMMGYRPLGASYRFVKASGVWLKQFGLLFECVVINYFAGESSHPYFLASFKPIALSVLVAFRAEIKTAS